MEKDPLSIVAKMQNKFSRTLDLQVKTLISTLLFHIYTVSIPMNLPYYRLYKKKNWVQKAILKDAMQKK